MVLLHLELQISVGILNDVNWFQLSVMFTGSCDVIIVVVVVVILTHLCLGVAKVMGSQMFLMKRKHM